MIKKHKKERIKRNIKDRTDLILFLLFCVFTLSFTVGYAALNQDLKISGEAMFRVQEDIRITNVSLYETTNLGLENYTMADMQKDESILNFVSDVNNYNYSETVAAAAGYKDAFGFALVEMLLPTLVKVSGYILLIIALTNVLKFVVNLLTSVFKLL